LTLNLAWCRRERENCGSSEARTTTHLPHTVSDILQEVLKVVHSSHIAALLLDLLQPTQFTLGCLVTFIRSRLLYDFSLNQLSLTRQTWVFATLHGLCESLVRVGHGTRARKVAGLELIYPKSRRCDELVNLAIEVASTSNTPPDWGEPILPAD
jgi:hypothetical protein